MPNIKLQTSDNTIIETDIFIVNISSTIKTIWEDCFIEDGYNAVVPLPSVSSATLSKILEWVNHHKYDDLELSLLSLDDSDSSDSKDSNDSNDSDETMYISPWDAEFINVDKMTLFQLINASNYLKIKGLYRLGCQTVANMLKGKKPDQVRQLLNIPNDLSPNLGN